MRVRIVRLRFRQGPARRGSVRARQGAGGPPVRTGGRGLPSGAAGPAPREADGPSARQPGGRAGHRMGREGEVVADTRSSRHIVNARRRRPGPAPRPVGGMGRYPNSASHRQRPPPGRSPESAASKPARRAVKRPAQEIWKADRLTGRRPGAMPREWRSAATPDARPDGACRANEFATGEFPPATHRPPRRSRGHTTHGDGAAVTPRLTPRQRRPGRQAGGKAL